MVLSDKVRIVISVFLMLIFFSLVTVGFGIQMGKNICVNGGGNVYSLNGVIMCVNVDSLDYCKDTNNVLFEVEDNNFSNFIK